LTTAQKELRYERVALMMHEGGLTVAQAEAYCNRNPALYGIQDYMEVQDGLFGGHW
jgi:hypothetical protein